MVDKTPIIKENTEELSVSENEEQIAESDSIEKTTENVELEIESFTMDITPANDNEETQQSEEVIIPNEEVNFYARGIEEVVENSLVNGTDNIYITEKKYILPIENLDNATYVDKT